jgi:hypothetical protein
VPKKELTPEEKLEALSQAAQAGWRKGHPVPDKHRTLVRNVVAKQLREEKTLSVAERRRMIQEEQRRMAEQQAQRQQREQRQERQR